MLIIIIIIIIVIIKQEKRKGCGQSINVCRWMSADLKHGWLAAVELQDGITSGRIILYAQLSGRQKPESAATQ
jgi:hypothetical protein